MATTAETAINYNSEGASTQTSSATDENASTFRWLLAWAIVIVLASLANKTRIGHTLMYYMLWLLLLFLVVTQYKFIAAALAPVGQPIPTDGDK
jgi:hypothetical protein